MWKPFSEHINKMQNWTLIKENERAALRCDRYNGQTTSATTKFPFQLRFPQLNKTNNSTPFVLLNGLFNFTINQSTYPRRRGFVGTRFQIPWRPTLFSDGKFDSAAVGQ